MNRDLSDATHSEDRNPLNGSTMPRPQQARQGYWQKLVDARCSMPNHRSEMRSQVEQDGQHRSRSDYSISCRHMATPTNRQQLCRFPIDSPLRQQLTRPSMRLVAHHIRCRRHRPNEAILHGDRCPAEFVGHRLKALRVDRESRPKPAMGLSVSPNWQKMLRSSRSSNSTRLSCRSKVRLRSLMKPLSMSSRSPRREQRGQEGKRQ